MFESLFSQRSFPKSTEDLMKISKTLGILVDQTALEIFSLYTKDLMENPITYIVPAVWGVKNGGDLTEGQKRMNATIAPMIQKMIRAFHFRKLSSAQEFALGYMVRGWFISKIIYMIEALRSNQCRKSDIEERAMNILREMDPVGMA